MSLRISSNAHPSVSQSQASLLSQSSSQPLNNRNPYESFHLRPRQPLQPPPPYHPHPPPPRVEGFRAREELYRLKQVVINRFNHWHHGGYRHFLAWDADRSAHIAPHIPIPPKLGPFPGWESPLLRRGGGGGGHGQPRDNLLSITRLEPMRAHPRGRFGHLAGLAAARGFHVRKSRKQKRARHLARWLEEGFGRVVAFKFKKLLGMGGQGAVFLFEMVGEDGTKVPVVVKGSIRHDRDGNDPFTEEKENLVSMVGAHHMVQRVVLQSLPYPECKKKTSKLHGIIQAFSAMTLSFGGPAFPLSRVPLKSQIPRPEEEIRKLQVERSRLDHRNDIIIMEYMSRGCIQDLIEKMVVKKVQLSSRALWLILECLFKACIAMAYPLRFSEQGKNLWNETHDQRDETVPQDANLVLPEAPLVHFDLDPQNALIGDYGLPGDKHEFVPQFKVSDLGLARFMDQRQRNVEADLWIFRMMGKPQFFLPEQFTQEWDFQASINLDYLRNEETAGNYHWWSNLYQVGWIMWSLITHCYPPAPPPLWPYQYPAIGDDDEDVTVKGYTYGGHLVNEAYTDYDRSLREIIMRMLDHNPRHRPSMMYMEEVLAEKTRRDDPLRRNMETDEQLKESTYRVFGEP